MISTIAAKASRLDGGVEAGLLDRTILHQLYCKGLVYVEVPSRPFGPRHSYLRRHTYPVRHSYPMRHGIIRHGILRHSYRLDTRHSYRLDTLLRGTVAP
jgi:hypothetical protein